MTPDEPGEKAEERRGGGKQRVNDTHFVSLCCILRLSGESHEISHQGNWNLKPNMYMTPYELYRDTSNTAQGESQMDGCSKGHCL